VIVLDTHIWVWWVHLHPQLPQDYQSYLQSNESAGLGISEISCWEIAKLVERGRLVFHCPVGQWLSLALAYPGIRLLPLSPEVTVASTQLPESRLRDPADQIIVATARIYDSPLVTMDQLIRAYPHVRIAPSP
jgi:PIN domain nuclease of toxin-antitoxin system